MQAFVFYENGENEWGKPETCLHVNSFRQVYPCHVDKPDTGKSLCGTTMGVSEISPTDGSLTI